MHSAMNGQPEPGLGMGGPGGRPGPPLTSMRMDGPHAPPPQAGGPPPQVYNLLFVVFEEQFLFYTLLPVKVTIFPMYLGISNKKYAKLKKENHSFVHLNVCKYESYDENTVPFSTSVYIMFQGRDMRAPPGGGGPQPQGGPMGHPGGRGPPGPQGPPGGGPRGMPPGAGPQGPRPDR